MSMSTTAQRRKGGGGAYPANKVISSTQVVHHIDDDAISSNSPSNALDAADERMNNIGSTTTASGGGHLMVEDIIQKEQQTVHATVRRNFCGTGPFDKHWLNVDCCGLVCAFLTYGLHVYGIYAVCFVLIPPWMSNVIVNNNNTDSNNNTGEQQQQQHSERYLTITGQLHRFMFFTMALLACIAHFKAMTTDPGAVPPDSKPLPVETTKEEDIAANGDLNDGVDPPRKPQQQQHLRLCRRCRAFKPARAHHCSICKRCIIKMDHHCPWVNNCVGIGNHKYFLLFVFYTFITCAYSLVLIVVRFSSCVHVHRRTAHHHAHASQVACLDQPTQLLTILGLLIESILFGMFTSCMMFDQQEVVHNKMTHIDRLKGLEIGGSLEGIAEVFGVRPSRSRRRRRDSDLSSSSSTSSISLPAAKDQTRFRLDWLSPFVSPCFPESAVDEVMGFCRPCRGGGGKGGKNNNSSSGTMTEMASSKLAPGSKVVRSVTEIV